MNSYHSIAKKDNFNNNLEIFMLKTNKKLKKFKRSMTLKLTINTHINSGKNKMVKLINNMKIKVLIHINMHIKNRLKINLKNPFKDLMICC